MAVGDVRFDESFAGSAYAGFKRLPTARRIRQLQRGSNWMQNHFANWGSQSLLASNISSTMERISRREQTAEVSGS